MENSGPFVRYRGPFAWQANNSTRIFEYPWAYGEVANLGKKARIVEIGGALSGLQFLLAREGHSVINVDPAPTTWEFTAERHRKLAHALHAPVTLVQTSVGETEIADASVDVALCVSTLEHLSDEELAEIALWIRRALAPDGIAILTIDLFLDLAPFTPAERNRIGRNIDVRAFLERCGLRLVKGTPSELNGFPEFDPVVVQTNLNRYLVGHPFPTLTQCLVAGF